MEDAIHHFAVGTGKRALTIRQIVFPFAFITFATGAGERAVAVHFAGHPDSFETVLGGVDQHTGARELAADFVAVIMPAAAPTDRYWAVLSDAFGEIPGEAFELFAAIGEDRG